MLNRLLPAIAGATLLASGCGEIRQSHMGLGEVPTVTFVDDVQPMLQSKCIQCHRGATPDGSYDLSSWKGLLGPGSDGIERNAVAGEAKSLLLVKAGADDAAHRGLLSAAQLALLRRWLVDEHMPYAQPMYHPRGWQYPADRDSVDFHGGDLRARRWDYTECRKCHGEDLTGGKSGKSCNDCHAGGVDGCGDTCHGTTGSDAPPPDLSWSIDPSSPGVGAHGVHAQSTMFAKVDCADCHPPVDTVDTPGHLYDDQASKTSDLKAEVVFSARAKTKDVQASYDQTTYSCAVYCHTLGNQGTTPPEWTAKATGNCDSCHGVPGGVPQPFGGLDCTICHQQVVELCQAGEERCITTGKKDANGKEVFLRFLDVGQHGDGAVSLGKQGLGGQCWSCHGTEESAGAPAPDVKGRTASSEVTVGLHTLHLKASEFTGPIACEACHVVPAADKDPGHVDDDLPAEIVFNDLASGKLTDPPIDTKPVWDRTTGTCSNVFCHSLPGAPESWSWTKATGSLTCSSCHGQPPVKTLANKLHPAGINCALGTCHPTAYTPEGKLDLTKHIDGKVDL